MEAIECGIVKRPRVPIADNIPGGDAPKFRNLWDNLRGTDLPKKGRGKAGPIDPLKIPAMLQTALEALLQYLYSLAGKWRGRATGFHRCLPKHRDLKSGWSARRTMGPRCWKTVTSRYFRNYEDYGNRLARPRALGAISNAFAAPIPPSSPIKSSPTGQATDRRRDYDIARRRTADQGGIGSI